MATIYDVAARAGVSSKTVSRVLNGDGPVGERTREAVEAAMRDLGYVPSNAARMMRSSRSGLIGLITGAISTQPEPGQLGGLPDILIVQGIQQAVAHGGMTLMIADTGGRLDRVPHLVQTFLRHRVEGLIYVAEYHQRVSLPPVPKGTPLVLANCFDDAGTPAVLPDDRRGQAMLTARLIEAGHRRIGFLMLRDGMVAKDLRLAGYRDALAAAGLPFEPGLARSCDFEGQAGGQLLWDTIDGMLRLAEPPTVIVCGNDKMALRVYGILRSRGVRVPDDLSVAGFDNHRVIAETLYPPLTTVELPYAAVGVRAAERLLSIIAGQGGAEAAPTLVSGPVCWRESVTERRAPNVHQLKTVREE